MSTRQRLKIAIYIGLLVVGLPLGFALLPADAMDIGFQYAETLAAVLLIACLALMSWRLKTKLKRRMEKGLRRPVTDEDLVSISTWMRIPDQAERAARDADKFDFDD